VFREGGKGFMINRENPNITEYNPNADYSINIPGLSNEVNQGLSNATRCVAEKGSAHQVEAMALVDLTTGSSVYDELGDFDSVGGDEFWEFVERYPNGRFAFVHSHMTDGFLSRDDMQTLSTNAQIQVMIATSNDGLKRIAYGDIKDYRLYDSIYTDDLENLRSRIKRGILEMADYRHEYQKLIVENAIRDFANLGFWEVDGRV